MGGWTDSSHDEHRHPPNSFIFQMTLGKSEILFVYENLFKTFGFIYIMSHDVSTSLIVALAMTLIFVTQAKNWAAEKTSFFLKFWLFDQ